MRSCSGCCGLGVGGSDSPQVAVRRAAHCARASSRAWAGHPCLLFGPMSKKGSAQRALRGQLLVPRWPSVCSTAAIAARPSLLASAYLGRFALAPARLAWGLN